MSESSNEFWNKQEHLEQRPVDLLVHAAKKERNPITPEATVEFVLGCQTIYFGLRQVNPDAVFIPLRGAKPIDWSLEEFEAFYGQSYPRIYLRIGDQFNVETGAQHGFTKPAFNETSLKRRMVTEELLNYKKMHANIARLEGHAVDEDFVIKRPLLIDEVMSGSTLTEASNFLLDELKKNYQTEKLNVIAAQDTRGREKRQKTAPYLNLVSNDGGDFNVTTVNLPLFHIDRSEILDFILEPSVKDEEKKNKMMHTLHNIESKDFFKFITRGVLYPKKLRDVVRSLRENSPSVHDDSISNFFKGWITGVMGNPEHFDKKIGREQFLDWLNQFTTAATAVAPLSHSKAGKK